MRSKPIAEIPEIPKDWVPERSSELVKKTYHFELITPMMGGDAESWHLNTKAPIRSQSVKGQLRFWWRTMQTETNSQKLLYLENEIWGGKYGDSDDARKQSAVKMSVVNQNSIALHQAHMDERNRGVDGSIIPKYVLFPITEPVGNGEQIHFVTKCKFDLVLSCPEPIFEAVENSLRFWCLLGGVGARTRRGTGSLYCPELLSMFEDENMLMSYLQKWTKTNDSKPQNNSIYPILRGARTWAKIDECGDPSAIWHGFLEAYGNYRQGEGIGRTPRNPATKRPGRSYWPEPDRIRAITNRFEQRHSKPENTESWFPRAAFGLPILTKFVSSDRQDPPQTILEPVHGSRWPSPMILKVIRLTRGKIVRLGFVLNQKPPEEIELTGQAPGLPHTLTADESPLSQVPGRKMKTHGNPLGSAETPYEHLFRYLNLEDFS